MKLAMNPLLVVVVALAFCTVVVEEVLASVLLKGMVPAGKEVVILKAHKQSGATDTLKFKFSAPAPTPGGYALSFCVGPATNPCGTTTSYVVSVPGGEERLAVIPAAALTNNVLTVGQGTTVALPFEVTME